MTPKLLVLWCFDCFVAALLLVSCSSLSFISLSTFCVAVSLYQLRQTHDSVTCGFSWASFAACQILILDVISSTAPF